MRTLPNIAGTVANWPLNGSLVDTSGSGLTLASIDQHTSAPQAPTYVTFDGCTQAADTTYDGVEVKSKLLAPSTPLLRFAGAFTYQWTMVQTRTFQNTYFCCANPAGRSGGLAPDRIGSLYTLFWNSTGFLTVTDQHFGSNLPNPGDGTFLGANNAAWGQVPVSTPPFAAPAAFAITRGANGNYHAYRNGVLISSVATAGANVPVGNERLYIGGIEDGGNSGAARFANVRVLNFERQAADVATDAALALGACPAAFQVKGVLATIRTA